MIVFNGKVKKSGKLKPAAAFFVLADFLGCTEQL
jgi:hypothetical protein